MRSCYWSICHRIFGLFIFLLSVNVYAAEQCTAVFPGGIQSHSPTGFIQMGYQSRVYGSGPTLNAPTVTHTHTYGDQYGFCDGVICTATGKHASTVSVSFLTGSDVPSTFELSSSSNNVSNGYRAGTLSLAEANYGTVSVGQESTVRFSTVNGTYRTKTITTNYKSTVEFQPGTYWINGNLDWTAQDTVIRRLSGTEGRVTLYVSGNVNIGQAQLQGFAAGQIRLYVQGNVSTGNDFIFPGEIHAKGSVGFGMNAVITGGVYSGNFSTGNTATIRYTRLNYDHKMGSLKPAYNSTFELSPGNYWIDGDFDASVAAKFRKIGGSGVVRLFVRGNINVQHAASFEGFSGGDLLMYSTGNITLTSQTDLPAFVYAVGDVTINFSNGARYRGGITGRNVYIGQGSIVQYLDPVDLGPLCDNSSGVDHYALNYSPTALTCQPVPVKVSAYDSQGNLLTVPSTVTLSPAGMWQGSGTLTFTGSGTAYMKRTDGTYTLGLSGADPQAINATLCSTSNCSIQLHDSGFIFKSLSPMIAGREQKASIQAVKKLDSGEACVPGFAAGTWPISFSSSYENPTTGTLSPVVADETLVPGATAKTISLKFDATATASLPVTYMDAGQVKLTARYEGSAARGDEGLLMTGSGSFVSRPWGLCIQTNTAATVTDKPTDQILAKAGDGFEQRMKAVIWTSGTDGDETDRRSVSLCSNAVTPNYQQASIALKSEVVAPSNGKSGALGATEYAQGKGVTTLTQTLSEVGIFRVIATPPNYLGESMGHAVSASGAVGRIIPAWLEVGAKPSQTIGCPNPALPVDGFTYQGQTTSMTGNLEVRGMSRGGTLTENYTGSFWRFTESGALSYELHQDSAVLVARDASAIAGRVSPQPVFTATSASASFLPSGSYSYTRLTSPSALDTPFSLKLAVWDWHDLDNVYFKRTDITQSVAARGLATTGVPVVAAISTSAFRLGRVRSENINLPTQSEGNVPLRLEQWTGAWAPAVDACTTVVSSVTEYPDSAKSGWLEEAEVKDVWTSAEKRFFQVKGIKPIPLRGSVKVRSVLNGPNNVAATWLCQPGSEVLGGVCTYDVVDNAVQARAAALVTFGLYQGPAPLIFRREVYR